MKTSHRYAQKRWEVISHLQPSFVNDKTGTQAKYKPFMQKVIAELQGAIGERKIKRPDGREVIVRVVNFPDGSFGRAPRDVDLEMEKEFTEKAPKGS